MKKLSKMITVLVGIFTIFALGRYSLSVLCSLCTIGTRISVRKRSGPVGSGHSGSQDHSPRPQLPE